MSRFCFCNCPAGFSADPERHAPDCPGRSGAGKSRISQPVTVSLEPTAAELQSTIARLTAENERLGLVEKESLQRSWQAGYDTGFYAKNPAHERERLNGGQGEPVGMLLIDEYFDNREVGEVDVQLDAEACELLAKSHPGQSFPLYTSQPAPVVLPEPLQDPGMIAGLSSRYAQGWNACLDKVKELNQ